jgi:hypothetical protein
VFEANMEALFEVHPRLLTIPRTLDEMQQVDVTGDRFTYDDLVEIAATHRDRRDEGSVRAFYVVFLDGLYHDEVREYPDLLGVSVRDAGVIVIFKPVVGDGELGAYYEQTTLVHEFGHAIGLVNAGIPMVEDHEDPAHPRHCSSDTCIMGWLNEAPSELRRQVPRAAWPPTSVLYGDQCLADVHTAAARM